MTFENAKVLHKHFSDLGMLTEAKQLEQRYPELKVKEEPKPEPKPEPKTEEKEAPKKDGKKSKR